MKSVSAVLFAFALLLTSALGGCSPKAPEITPEVELEVVSGTGSESFDVVGQEEEPLDVDKWSLLRGHASLYADGNWWRFDPQEVSEIIVPGKGSVTFDVTGGGSHSFELSPGIDEISFSVDGHKFCFSVNYVSSLDGKAVLQLGLYEPRELALPFAGVLPVLSEDTILLTVNWPFGKEELESALRAGLGAHLRSWEWISPQELLIHISGEPGDKTELFAARLPIIAGYDNPYSPSGQTDIDFSLEFFSAPVIKKLNLLTGEYAYLALPFHVDQVTRWNEIDEVASMKKTYYLPAGYGESYLWRQEFSYSLRDKRVVGEVIDSSEEFPHSRQQLYATAKLEWPPSAYVFSHVGGSPSGKLSAALFCSPTGNLMLIHDHDSGVRVLHQLMSSASDHWPGGANEIFWSHDETHAVYRPFDDSGLQGVYILNLLTGDEHEIWPGDEEIVSVSSVDDHVLLHHPGDKLYVLADFEGSARLLPQLAPPFTVVQWLSNGSFLATTGEQSFIYDTVLGATTMTMDGQAFALDVDSQILYLLVQ